MEKDNIINGTEQSGISLINCVLENTQVDGEVYPIFYIGDHSNVVLRSVTIIENPKLYLKSYVGNSKLEMDNCVFQDCRIILENVDFKNEKLHHSDRGQQYDTCNQM